MTLRGGDTVVNFPSANWMARVWCQRWQKWSNYTQNFV